jgi:hypothetical protein
MPAPIVAFFRKKCFDEITSDRELDEITARGDRGHRNALERSIRLLTIRYIIGGEDPFGHSRKRQMGERMTHLAVGIAELQSPC